MKALMLLVTLAGPAPVSAQPVLPSAPSVTTRSPDDDIGGRGNVSELAPQAEETPNGNPLWAIPLATLNATRERPLFSPTRRPPPVANVAPVDPVVRIPTNEREPERLQLALVGTIIGQENVFGVFVDNATKDVVRLRPGDGYHGWVLRSVHGREATLEKDEQAATLSLPQPSEELAKSISRRPK